MEIDNLNISILFSYLAAIFPKDFLKNILNNNLDLVSQGPVPEKSQLQDFRILIKIINNIGDIVLNSFTSEKYYLFVLQLTS